MDLFDWRSQAGRQHLEKGAIRPVEDGNLAPSPTAPFADLFDEQGRRALPDLGAQDPFILGLFLEAMRRRDPAFDAVALARLAADAMVAVERAWTTLDPQPSRAYLSPALWASHRARMELYALHGRRNVIDKLQVVSSRLVALSEDGGRDRATVRVRASSTDYDVDGAGNVVRGDAASRTWEEDWVLERSAAATTRGDGGLLGGHCPACGAPLALDGDGMCSYCHAAVTDATHDWVVVAVADVGREQDVLRAVLGVRTHVRLDDFDLSPKDEVVSITMPVTPSDAAPPPDLLAPLRLRDRNLDATAVLAAARTAFVAWRTALLAMDAAPLRPVADQATVDALEDALSALRSKGLRAGGDDPLVDSAGVISANPEADADAVTVRVAATLVDADLDAAGAAVRGDMVPHPRQSDVSLRRRLGGVDAAAAPRCPRCGAPLRASITGICDFCREAVAGGGGEWLLVSLPQLAATPAASVDGPGGASSSAAPPPLPTPFDTLRAADPDVNEAELLARARECFFAVEGAVGRAQVDQSMPYVTASFLDALRRSQQALAATHRHRVLAFIDIERARLTHARDEDDGLRATVRIDVSGEDTVVADTAGAMPAGDAPAQRRWSEDWTLLRPARDAPWVVEAAGQAPAAG